VQVRLQAQEDCPLTKRQITLPIIAAGLLAVWVGQVPALAQDDTKEDPHHPAKQSVPPSRRLPVDRNRVKETAAPMPAKPGTPEKPPK